MQGCQQFGDAMAICVLNSGLASRDVYARACALFFCITYMITSHFVLYIRSNAKAIKCPRCFREGPEGHRHRDCLEEDRLAGSLGSRPGLHGKNKCIQMRSAFWEPRVAKITQNQLLINVCFPFKFYFRRQSSLRASRLT